MQCYRRRELSERIDSMLASRSICPRRVAFDSYITNNNTAQNTSIYPSDYRFTSQDLQELDAGVLKLITGHSSKRLGL